MNQDERDHLRRIAGMSIRSEQSIARFFSESSTCDLACAIESFEGPFQYRNGLSILFSIEAGVGAVSFFSRFQDAESTWDCNTAATRLRREVARLEKLGLWELNDFTPSAELMDGTCLIIRALNRELGLTVEACLMSSDYAISPFLRSFHNAAFRLLNLDREYFSAPQQSWRRFFGR